MTHTEAEQGAAARHEFRMFLPKTVHSPAAVDAVAAECWCGAETPAFLTQRSARDAHGRHQDREQLINQ